MPAGLPDPILLFGEKKNCAAQPRQHQRLSPRKKKWVIICTDALLKLFFFKNTHSVSFESFVRDWDLTRVRAGKHEMLLIAFAALVALAAAAAPTSWSLDATLLIPANEVSGPVTQRSLPHAIAPRHREKGEKKNDFSPFFCRASTRHHGDLFAARAAALARRSCGAIGGRRGCLVVPFGAVRRKLVRSPQSRVRRVPCRAPCTTRCPSCRAS